MSHVDCLSRDPVSDTVLVSNIVNITESEWVAAVQSTDDDIQFIINVLNSPRTKQNKNYFENYTLKKGILYRQISSTTKWVVPRSCRWLICKLNHDEGGHFGFDKTLEKIKRNYWFKNMRSFVKKYVQACLNCMYMKATSGPRSGLLNPIPKVPIPFCDVHLDHIGPFVPSKKKNAYLLVLIDGFTKFVFLRAVKSTNTKYVIQFLEDFMFLFGSPSRIITDRGSSFTAKAMESYCLKYNIKHILNAVATPRANGQCEGVNHLIAQSLRCLSVNDDTEELWDTHIPEIQFAINSAINKTTGKSPFMALMGINPKPLADSFILNEVGTSIAQADLSILRNDLKDKIDIAQQRQKANFDRKRKIPERYTVGDLVLVRKTAFPATGFSQKLMPKFRGPFRVIKVLDHDRYVVQSMINRTSTTTVVAIDSMKPWIVLNDPQSQPTL